MKLTKVLLGSALSLTAVAIPTSITSCAQNWGKLTPYNIGSGTFGPYTNLLRDDEYLDYDGQNITKYIQNSYVVHSAKSINYAYSAPMKFEDNPDVKQDNDWKLGTVGWYSSSDSALSPSAVDKYKNEEGKKVSQTVNNARNATLVANIDFVNSIGIVINNYINYALQYQASQANMNEDDSNIQIAWGSKNEKHAFALDHGAKDGVVGSPNSVFYEYLLALSNLTGKSKVNAMLRTSSLHFEFEQMPLPTYTFDGTTRKGLSDVFVKLLEGQTATAESFSPTYYKSKSKDYKDKDEDEYNTYSYEAVPVIVSLDRLKFDYLDPTKDSSSFIVNDYYSDATNITKAVSNTWAQPLNAFAGLSAENSKPHYKTFNLRSSESLSLPKPTDGDARLGNISGSSFVALINYSVNVYKTKPEKNTATINGMGDLFPAYLLELYTDVYKEANADTHVKVIDSSKINKITSKLMGLIQRSSDQGRIAKAKDLNQESKNLLGLLGYMFSDTESKIDTSSILETDNPI